MTDKKSVSDVIIELRKECGLDTKQDMGVTKALFELEAYYVDKIERLIERLERTRVCHLFSARLSQCIYTPETNPYIQTAELIGRQMSALSKIIGVDFTLKEYDINELNSEFLRITNEEVGFKEACSDCPDKTPPDKSAN